MQSIGPSLTITAIEQTRYLLSKTQQKTPNGIIAYRNLINLRYNSVHNSTHYLKGAI